MKITRLETIQLPHLNNILWVRLHTDEGLPPADGQTYVLPGGAFFDIRDDRIARVTNYYNLQDWIRQVRRDHP